MTTTDAQLVAQCRAGSLAAFERIYAQHERAVYRHAYYLLGHRDDADDITQETFLRAHRSLSSFRSGSSLKTWLFRICTNLCHDHLRVRLRRPEVAFDFDTLSSAGTEAGEHSDPVQTAIRTDSLQRLMIVLQGMPPAERSVIVLHLIEGLGYDEIAEILGCRRGSAKMRVLRATRRFRERVTSYLGEGGQA
jgi:RNA polymerase sigma-70 factor (ECF subfamily)